MKKSKFIKKVISSKENTVFVNAEQVENALAVFEKLGMRPPATDTYQISTLSGEQLGTLPDRFEWDKE